VDFTLLGHGYYQNAYHFLKDMRLLLMGFPLGERPNLYHIDGCVWRVLSFGRAEERSGSGNVFWDTLWMVHIDKNTTLLIQEYKMGYVGKVLRAMKGDQMVGTFRVLRSDDSGFHTVAVANQRERILKIFKKLVEIENDRKVTIWKEED